MEPFASNPEVERPMPFVKTPKDRPLWLASCGARIVGNSSRKEIRVCRNASSARVISASALLSFGSVGVDQAGQISSGPGKIFRNPVDGLFLCGGRNV